MKPVSIGELRSLIASQRVCVQLATSEMEVRNERIVLLALRRWLADKQAFAAKPKKRSQ